MEDALTVLRKSNGKQYFDICSYQVYGLSQGLPHQLFQVGLLGFIVAFRKHISSVVLGAKYKKNSHRLFFKTELNNFLFKSLLDTQEWKINFMIKYDKHKTSLY